MMRGSQSLGMRVPSPSRTLDNGRNRGPTQLLLTFSARPWPDQGERARLVSFCATVHSPALRDAPDARRGIPRDQRYPRQCCPRSG
ncbi:hypothetical protein RHCRD62_20721 [Rhodococcus sp. RD6.2]|nr:hypothetical protein RHCRD62_20721 [Rhodococcus sp. RD6.2]